MTSFNQLIHGGLDGQPSLDEVVAELITTGSKHSVSKREAPETTPSASSIAFVSLLDLMRSTASTEQTGEICEGCKTLNRRGACYCKTCMHKLPAYYASANPRTPFLTWSRREREESRTSAWDLAAVWVVLTSLVLMTAYAPVG